jgi:acetyl-CoA C-acetyltransferase
VSPRRPAASSAALIGWSQASRHPGEPLEAWAAALLGTGVTPDAIDSLDVVYCQSWPYDDPAGRLAASVWADPKRLHYSGIGGTTPLTLLARAAERIAMGESEVCAIVGGEALATVRQIRRDGGRPQWSHRDPEKKPFPYEAPFQPSEVAHQVFQAYTTFALRDVARRAHLGAGVDEHAAGIGRLFAPMTEVASRNPHAWFPRARSATELMEVTEWNRVVAHPFTKLVMAMMDVDLSAALVLASEGAADRLGIAADRRVHLRGWAEDRDPDYVAEHDELWRSPGMRTAFSAALQRAAVGTDDIAHFDLYSCFPSSVSFSLDALGIDASDDRGPFTVTGGLPYAGGPGSCYALSSVAAMADTLVHDPGSVGLVTGVGMHLSKHAAVVLSTEPGAMVAASGPVGAVQKANVTRRPIVEQVDGPTTVAAYTVHHDSNGEATDGLLVCDVEGHPAGGRCYAKVADAELLAAFETEEWVGRRVQVRHVGGLNVGQP